MSAATAVDRLELEGLALYRGSRFLFQDLSACFCSGETVEIVGPNGAGKTSLLRAIAGFLPPRAGAIRFLGPAGPVEEPQTCLHLIAHRDGLKAPLTPRAHLSYWAGLFGAPQAGLEDALERVGLLPLADLPARALSQGQGRRLALARLLAVPRPVWLLDEPAAALDAAGKALLQALIAAHTGAGGVAIAAVHEPLGVPARQLALAAA